MIYFSIQWVINNRSVYILLNYINKVFSKNDITSNIFLYIFVLYEKEREKKRVKDSDSFFFFYVLFNINIIMNEVRILLLFQNKKKLFLLFDYVLLDCV